MVFLPSICLLSTSSNFFKKPTLNCKRLPSVLRSVTSAASFLSSDIFSGSLRFSMPVDKFLQSTFFILLRPCVNLLLRNLKHLGGVLIIMIIFNAERYDFYTFFMSCFSPRTLAFFPINNVPFIVTVFYFVIFSYMLILINNI